MNDLPAKLDEIGAHYSACDQQQTIYAAAREIEFLTSENERLRKALEIAGKRLYKQGAPHSYVDDVNRVLDGEEVEYYD